MHYFYNMYKLLFRLLGILLTTFAISCSHLQTSRVQCPDLSGNSHKTKNFKSSILTLTRIKSYKQSKQTEKTQLNQSIVHNKTPKVVFIETSPTFSSNSLLTASYEYFDISFGEINYRTDSPPVNLSKIPEDTTKKERESLTIMESNNEQNNENTYYKYPEDKNPDFSKNLIIGWLLTIASLVLILLAILALVVPVLTVFLLIAAMLVAFSALEKSWDALTAKGAGPLRILAIPPLIVSATISLILLIIIGIISLFSD